MTISNPGGGRQVASGIYTGDDGGARQISVGFKCTLVVVTQTSAIVTGDRVSATLTPNTSTYHIYSTVAGSGQHSVGGNTLHATDGFVVNTILMNVNLYTYGWWALEA